MLLTSVILVLREVMEAAVLVSALVALSRSLGLGLRWVWLSLPLALVGSIWFASSMDAITDAFDGAGQEVINATLQLLVFACLLVVVFLEGTWSESRRSVMLSVMISAVALALVREGSEIWIYVSGFAAAADFRTPVLTGSLMGAGIGISLGVLLYACLRALPAMRQLPACLILLALIGAGMVIQASMLLEQVDWLESGQSLWDSSFLVSESSLSGELLYAVFGYEATPSATQGVLYLSSLIAMAMAYCSARVIRKRLNEQ